MNKKELLQAISIESGLSLKDSKIFLKAFTNVIVEDVKTGGKTSIPKFGSFSCRHKGPRPGRNMHTGAPTYEVARRTPEATVIVVRFGIVLACKLQI